MNTSNNSTGTDGSNTESKQESVISDGDLWDNPMVRSALASMSPEVIKDYKLIGEQLYGSIDFESSTVLNNMPPPMLEALAYIKSGLDSGLHPRDLEKDEIVLLKEAYGDEWYKKWEYTDADLFPIDL
jgi:hypothetical protein